MRQLNTKQRQLLDKWIKENNHLPGLAVCDVVKDYLDYDFFNELKSINDFETIYNHINQYVHDNV